MNICVYNFRSYLLLGLFLVLFLLLPLIEKPPERRDTVEVFILEILLLIIFPIPFGLIGEFCDERKPSE